MIPGTTPGLKRTKKTEDLPHYVPLIKEMNAMLKQAKEMNGHLPYVYGPDRKTADIHIWTLNHPKTCSRDWDTEKSYVLMVGGHYL